MGILGRMGFSTGGKAWLRWWTLLSVVVVVAATVDNKPADGYLNSGYFWPKTIYWEGIRRPPGIYWFVFFFYFWAAAGSLSGSILSVCIRPFFAADTTKFKRFFDIASGLIFTCISTFMGLGLLFISVAATNLSDVVQGYFIGMCIIQVIVDALRSILSCKSENTFVVYFTLFGFQVSAALGIAMLDSYRPLNQLNCAYSFLALVINILTTAASVSEKKRSKVAGFIGASIQMLFCVAAYTIANQVADVNKKQTGAFFCTAFVNFVLVTFSQMIAACSNRSVTKVQLQPQHPGQTPSQFRGPHQGQHL